MPKSGFVSQEDFQSHKDKDWRTVHSIWPNIRGVTVGPRPKGSVGAHTHIKVDITDTPWAWADVSKTGSNLTDLTTRQHAGLTDVTENQHHNKLHSMTGVQHSAAGLTIGWVIKATGATTFAWGQLPHDKLGGLGDDDHAQYLLASGARALTAAWDAGGYQIRALKFYSDQATGTAPFTVLSTTKVNNLNVDRWNGHQMPALVAEKVLTTLDGVNLSWWRANFNWLSDLNIDSPEEGETIRYDQATTKWIDAWGIDYDNPRLVYKMYTDFISASENANDPWIGGALPDGGSRASVAGTSNHPGIVRFNSTGVLNSGFRFVTFANCFLIGGAEHSEFCFKTPANLANVRVRLGYQDSFINAAPTDGVFIDIAATVLSGKTYNNTAGSTTGTTHTIAVNTWYRGKIAVNNNATLVTFVLYSAAGSQLWSDTLAANIPTATGREVGHGAVAWIGAASGRPLIDIDMMIATRAGYITR